jgi:hypothetical protein
MIGSNNGYAAGLDGERSSVVKGETRAISRLGNAIGAAIFALSAASATIPANLAYAQDADRFSFVAYGDSRTMMYLPYTQADTGTIHAALVNVFALILGERVAEEIVKKTLS